MPFRIFGGSGKVGGPNHDKKRLGTRLLRSFGKNIGLIVFDGEIFFRGVGLR